MTKEIKIPVNVGDSTENEEVYNAGLMFEHNTTMLNFKLDGAYFSSNYKYYLDFATPSGILRTDYLVPNEGKAITFLLPAAVTSQMSVICYLNIIKVDEITYETEMVIKPKRIRLNFATVEGDSKELAESYDFSINAMLEAIKNGDFKGEKGDKGDTGAKGDKGDKGDTGTVIADSQLNAESSNPVENKAITAALDKKIDKVNGMGLSSNDFTDGYKLKIDSAEKTANKITEFTGTQTDEQYPSARLVYDNFVLSQIYTDNGLAQKVDKVSGKTLSTNDFTNSLKQKLNGIESGANKTVTDSSLSNMSANPVENKVIKAELDKKVDKANGKGLTSNDFTDEYKLRIDGAEKTANKITEFTGAQTDEQYPSAKAVKAELDKKLNLSGGTMTGNLGMDGNDILNVKKIIFLSQNGEWLNMSNHPITNLATPTADHHAATKAYVDTAFSGSKYTPVALADTVLTQEAELFSVNTYNNIPFYCNEFTVQLDVPSTDTVSRIDCSIKRSNGSYQSVNSDASSIKTVTDAERHTLAIYRVKLHNKVYGEFSFGGQQAATNVNWNSIYCHVQPYTNSVSLESFSEKGTPEIRVKPSIGTLPVGTIIKIWGKIIPAV